MYYEFESRFNMDSLVFDDDTLTVGSREFPYADIDKMEVTSAPLFATYGILTVTIGEKEIPIPFPRSYSGKINRVIHEIEKERERSKEQGSEKERGNTGTSASFRPDPYEEVKKLKELLDLGIVTPEEFEKKKKELLGL